MDGVKILLVEALDLQPAFQNRERGLVHLDAYLVQQKANVFRKGYQNWRAQGLRKRPDADVHIGKGAAKEMVAAVSHEATVADALQILAAGRGGAVTSQQALSMVSMGSMGSLGQAAGSSAQFSGAQSLAALPHWASKDQLAPAEGPPSLAPKLSRSSFLLSRDELTAGVGGSVPHLSNGGLEQDEAQHPEHWTKFYTTPFTAMAPAARPVVPLTRRVLEEPSPPRPGLQLPTYPRSCECAMVHIGVGNFHRSHQAYYTDQLLQYYHDHPSERPSETYGIYGLGLRPRQSETDPGDELMFEVMQQQNSLYTVVFRSAQGTDARVVGAMMDYLLAPHDFPAAIDRLAHPSTRIVSLTVTEKGYLQNVHGALDTAHPAVTHDFEHYTRCPKTAYGIITAALKLRKERGQKGLSVLSCDNMPDNGDTVRRLLLQFVERCDPSLKSWVEEHVSFPNTMVDRITAVTEQQHKVLCVDEFGLDDQWPVFAEHFGQWVVEDHFVAGRPEWEKVGVLFVPDVKPYEYMKLRLLNGGHSALAYVSYLAGHVIVDGAMADAELSAFVRAYLHSVKPCIPPVPGVDVEDYIDTLMKRFSNAYLKDKVARLAEDGSKKLYSTMRGPLLELSASGHPTRWLALAVAAFIHFMSGTDLDAMPIRCIKDPMAEVLGVQCYEAVATGDVRGPLELVFGPEVVALEPVVQQVAEALQALKMDGALDTIQQYLATH